MNSRYNRRDFIKQSSAVGVSLALANLGQTEQAHAEQAKEYLKVGFVGVGRRGSNLLKILLEIKGVRMKAFCDIRPDRVTRAQRWTTEANQPEPSGYSRGETDFKRMCENEDLDLVITGSAGAHEVARVYRNDGTGAMSPSTEFIGLKQSS